MPSDAPVATDRPVRWGLAAKLFAILVLLGAIGILVTGILGYESARSTLEDAIYDQLTVARRTKVAQVETYFRTVHDHLRMLAQSKMVVDAARDFHRTFDELEQKGSPDALKDKVRDWYAANVMADVALAGIKDTRVDDFLPTSPAGTYLQYNYIVANPHPEAQRSLLDDAGDGSAYSAQHRIYHPLLREAAATAGFVDLLLVDAQSGRITYGMAKEVDFASSVRSGPLAKSNIAAAAARCLAIPDRSVTCLADFAAYFPSDGAPIAFMAAPVIERGVVTGALIAQLSTDEIDRVVTGNRHWREDGFGATGEAYLVGPNLLLRSGGRLFYEDRDRYFAELTESGAPAEEIQAIRRYGSPVLHQQIDGPATRAAISGIEGAGQVVGNFGRLTLASWGPLNIPGVKWGLVAKIESSEAFAPIDRLRRELLIVGALALIVVILAGAWLSRSLLAPLLELTAGVRRFASGDHATRVAVRSRDEIGQLCAAFNGMVGEISAKNLLIEVKNNENEELLLNVLPAPIANRLRGGEKGIADGFANVTVLFADLVGFTELSSQMPPHDLVTLLNGLFSRFDMAAHELGIEKIKTVGDAYMAVCGMPNPVPDHAERLVRMAIRMVHITREHAMEHRAALQLRVGLNSGPVVAGVIGRSKYIYDLWGDTVNLASRMESGGVPGAIQVTRPVYEALRDRFAFEPRGSIEVKGKGQVEAWLLRL